MLPRVKIVFENGALGSVAPGADGVAGLICTSAGGLIDRIQQGVPSVVYSLADLVFLGASETGFLYRQVKEFYDEAGDGAELWLLPLPNTVKQSDMLLQTTVLPLLTAAQGRIRVLAVAHNSPTAYTPVITDGMDADTLTAMFNANQLGNAVEQSLFAPLFTILEARYITSSSIMMLRDLGTSSYNRVAVMAGDTDQYSNGAAVGLLLGRIARIPVQRHIGRVKDGAVKTVSAFIAGMKPELAYMQVDMLQDKGYITFRTFIGKAGYFFNDDHLATPVIDDYHSIARRRTIDKAYRIAYLTLLEFLNDEIPVTNAGTIAPALAKSWESEVETAIVNQMTAEGNLGVDPDDPDDKGVKCYIDYNQDVVATSKIEISLKVKPYGYAKYIDVKLGFLIEK
jgi:hypothetical protein